MHEKFIKTFLLSLILIMGLFLWLLPEEQPYNVPIPKSVSGHPYVIDGDSLRIKGQEFRLKGIDAPELHQNCYKNRQTIPCGKEAKEHMLSLIKGKIVSCVFNDFDRYHRALALCYTKHTNLNQQMILDGYAVSYHDYALQEAIAKQEKRGIWAYRFTKPYLWRKKHPYHPKNNQL